MVIAHNDFLILLQPAPFNASDGDPAHEFIIVDGADQHLEWLVHIGFRGGDILQNGVKQRLEVRAGHGGGAGSGALASGAEQHGGIQLFRGSVQVHQKLQHLVNDLIDPLVRPVDFIHDHNHPMSQFQSAAEDEPGLRHRSLGGVHQKNHAVDHFQHPFHLAAEIRVARGVHNVDLGVPVLNGGILSQDGNTPFPFQVAGVHDPFHNLLIFAVHAALLEHLVYQGGLAVVDVGDDGDIS